MGVFVMLGLWLAGGNLSPSAAHVTVILGFSEGLSGRPGLSQRLALSGRFNAKGDSTWRTGGNPRSLGETFLGVAAGSTGRAVGLGFRRGRIARFPSARRVCASVFIAWSPFAL